MARPSVRGRNLAKRTRIPGKNLITTNLKIMKKVETINLKGKDYATVPARIKEFRSDCPNGLITTSFEFHGEQIVFKARILRDKSDENSAEGTGHSLGPTKGEKNFEKLETIAVGRALSMLGYMASGDVASSEEMEEFLEEKEMKLLKELQAYEKKIMKIETIEDLSVFYKEMRANGKGRGQEFDKIVTERKQQLLSNAQENENS
jgi:hypothetical protein